ncbi:MAG: hypothetical protein WB973_04190 [Thermoanaerobaculia bacterium]
MSFVYHANALAFGGVLRNPCCDVLPSTGSVVLSPSGGEGSETVRNFNYKGIISFDEASVYVGGSKRGKFRNTISTVSIRNLNILNMLHADLVIGRVTSEHLQSDDPQRSECTEPEFTFEGSILENLTLAGRKVDVKLDHGVFSRYATYSSFVSGFSDPAGEGDDAVSPRNPNDAKDCRASRYGKRFCWPPERCSDGPPRTCDVIRASLVSSMDIPETTEDFSIDDDKRRDKDRGGPVRRNGYVVRIADFGTIAIGEVILKQHQRTVNMLRFTLGSPHDGEFTAGSGTTNGTDMYP